MKMSTISSNDPLSLEIPKKPANKTASEHRKATKPIMEKRRRARINRSLDDLKSLILEATNKDPSRHSKLEKADILEMTVRYLQNLQSQNAKNKYSAGFTECATLVECFLNRPGVDAHLKVRLMDHLAKCVSNTPDSFTNVAFPGMVPPQENSRVQFPYPSSPPSSASSTIFTFTFPPMKRPPSSPIQFRLGSLSPSSTCSPSPSDENNNIENNNNNHIGLNNHIGNRSVWRPW